jgi:hypothetical protein
MEERPTRPGESEVREDTKHLEDTVSRLKKDISAVEENSKDSTNNSLRSRWKTAVSTYKLPALPEGVRDYPRMQRLFQVIRADGKMRLILSYDEYNPDPDLRNLGERRQVEALLKFEEPLTHLMAEAGNRWREGDFEGEAALLEEYAASNPQRDAILDLAAEARRDALSGATARSRQRRR